MGSYNLLMIVLLTQFEPYWGLGALITVYEDDNNKQVLSIRGPPSSGARAVLRQPLRHNFGVVGVKSGRSRWELMNMGGASGTLGNYKDSWELMGHYLVGVV